MTSARSSVGVPFGVRKHAAARLPARSAASGQRAPRNRRQTLLKVLVCVVALVVAAVPTLFLNTIYGYLPVLVVGFSMAFSAACLWILKRSLAYTEEFGLASCRRGSNFDFEVRIKNRSPLVFPKVEPWFAVSSLFEADDTLSSAVITLAPREERDFSFSVRFDHIGTYSAGLRRIVITDLLGLFSTTLENTKRCRISVEPKMYALDRPYLLDKTPSDSERMIVPTVTDTSEYIGVREYVWGDPIKTIHWKLSARAENYLTKQFEGYGTVGVTIVLDFFSPSYDSETLMSVFDCIVETALSVGNYAYENGMEYAFVYTARTGEKRKYQGHFTGFAELVDDMPGVSAEKGGRTGIELLREEGTARYAHGNIVYCTANVTEELAGVVSELKARKKNPMVFAVTPETLKDKQREDFLRPLRLLSNTGVTWIALADASELGKELR
ncbi:MAG: DUF58 domain-containing protein [Coriobacteriia bacterium]|nr:DUF58 domain-containing protein [Coriobacteriia bacterium]